MFVKEIVAKCKVGDVVWRYSQSLQKVKIVTILEKSHSMVVEDGYALPWLCYDYFGGFYLTMEDAIEGRKKAVTEQIKELQDELQRLSKMK